MLVFTRKNSESVIINDDILIKVLDINCQQVKLGFEAPKNISVHREEVYQRIQEEKRKPDLS